MQHPPNNLESRLKFLTRGITRLRHEPLDVPVPFAAVVVTGGGERDEVLGGLGALLAVQLQLQVAHVAVQGYRHGDAMILKPA